jgi:uncharacterized membrane protein (UPF0182 family)
VVLISIFAAVTAVSRLLVHVETERLWYSELGQEHVFWTLIVVRWVGASLVFLATTVFLVANFWFVERMAPAPEPEHEAAGHPAWRRRLLAAYFAVSIGAGVIAGRAVAGGDWQQILLWLHRRDFGITDPEFHRDVGYFVFSLPLYEKAAVWLLALVISALLVSFVGHVATGAIRLAPKPVVVSRAARAHVLGLGALLLIIVAWRHHLAGYALELPRAGVQSPGGYTDMHVQLLCLRSLVGVGLFGAAALLYGAVRRTVAVPVVAVIFVVLAEIASPWVLPSVVQRYFVDPQALSRERPYIARRIRFTQLAYGLRDVAERPLPAAETISTQELQQNRDVLQNIQLWDTKVLNADIDEHQSIGSYYRFRNSTVDRYRQGGRDRMMIVAERELDLSRLDPSGRTWANDRLAYTHGYGLVALPAGGVDTGGRPTFTNSEFNAGPVATRVSQPRLYYGVQTAGAQPWVITRTRRAEVERPLSGSAPEPNYRYDGRGGIRLGDPFRRAAFALRFGELNLLISSTIEDGSRVMMRRDVRDRVKTLAPFLRWDASPEVAVVGGRIQFLMHGYTASDSYPYSTRTEVGGTELNYMRSDALAVVDGFSGKVTIYATDGDPILSAWREIFPTLFTPASQMPAAVRAHVRYPEALFDAQARVWATYHAQDVDDFYTGIDAWQRPADLSGPLDRVGSIRFRQGNGQPLDPAKVSLQDEERAPRLPPSYLLARLPGESSERFMLTTMFTPHSQENLSGYLAGSMDERGRQQLTQLTLPRTRLVLGPAQVSRLILATPAVGDQLRLLNQETTDLGNRSVDAVEIGEPRVVPIADGFLYVQSIYVTAHGSGVTRLRLVTVYLNGHVGYGRNLDEAIKRAQGSAAAAATAGRPPAPPAAPERAPG